MRAVTDQNGNKMSVALTRVIDPPRELTSSPPPTTATGSSARCSPSPASAGRFRRRQQRATLIGSNGQTYTAGFDSIAGYTGFNNGEYPVSAGENSVGAVTFQVPLAVKVAKIEWSANGGFGGAPAEWLVPAPPSQRPWAPSRGR
jgi:hypothetical protein